MKRLRSSLSTYVRMLIVSSGFQYPLHAVFTGECSDGVTQYLVIISISADDDDNARYTSGIITEKVL